MMNHYLYVKLFSFGIQVFLRITKCLKKKKRVSLTKFRLHFKT